MLTDGHRKIEKMVRADFFGIKRGIIALCAWVERVYRPARVDYTPIARI
jgi:hypothetical protein